MSHSSVQAVVLAAGKSTGFNTGKTKLVEKLCGQEMILYTTRLLESLTIPTIIVVGYQKKEIEHAIIRQHGTHFSFIEQEEQHGTAHAIVCSQTEWEAENILVMYGDMPLISKDVIPRIYQRHLETQATITITTSHVSNPLDSSYARIIKKNDEVHIVRAQELSDDINEHCCINAGIYVIKKSFLQKHIATIQKSECSKEFHISDLVNIATQYKEKVVTVPAPFDEVRGINTLEELWAAEQIKRSQLIKYWMSKGVRFSVAQNVHIDLNVTIGNGTFIGCGTHLLGNTQIGSNSTISEFSSIENSSIGDNSIIEPHSIIKNSTVQNNATVGPFAHVRDNAHIGNNVHIGNFVEVKKSTIGDYSKAKHLTYLGDATIGKKVNIGAGTITCNHDGAQKHQTIIGENAYIGSNNTLVAPVTIEKHAFTAAGSTITENVPNNTLAVGRARQINKEGYADKLLDKKRQYSIHKNNSNKKSSFLAARKSESIKNNNL